ncbi:regulator of nonsense transcripts UPF2 [Tanacetum coccineum]
MDGERGILAISVNTYTGETFSLQVKGSDTIISVKFKITDKIHYLLPDEQLAREVMELNANASLTSKADTISLIRRGLVLEEERRRWFVLEEERRRALPASDKRGEKRLEEVKLKKQNILCNLSGLQSVMQLSFLVEDLFADLRPDMTRYSTIEEVDAAPVQLEEHGA